MLEGLIILSLAFMAWHFGEKYARDNKLDDTEEKELAEKLKTYKGRQLTVEEQKEYIILKKTRFAYQNSFMQSFCLFIISFLSYILSSGFFESKIVCYIFVVLTSIIPSYIFANKESKKDFFSYVFWNNYLMLLFFNVYAWVQRFYTIEYKDWMIPLYLLLPYFGVLKFILNKIGDLYERTKRNKICKTV